VLQSVRQAQDNNVTLVLIIVVIVFSVCQAPALLNQIFWNVLDNSARDCGGFQFYYSRVSNMLVVTNSAVNFPIYAVFNTRFRQVLGTQVMPCLGAAGGGGSSAGAGGARRAGGGGGGGSAANSAAPRRAPGGYAAMMVDEDAATIFNKTAAAAATTATTNGRLEPPPSSPVVTTHL